MSVYRKAVTFILVLALVLEMLPGVFSVAHATEPAAEPETTAAAELVWDEPPVAGGRCYVYLRLSDGVQSVGGMLSYDEGMTLLSAEGCGGWAVTLDGNRFEAHGTEALTEETEVAAFLFALDTSLSHGDTLSVSAQNMTARNGEGTVDVNTPFLQATVTDAPAVLAAVTETPRLKMANAGSTPAPGANVIHIGRASLPYEADGVIRYYTFDTESESLSAGTADNYQLAVKMPVITIRNLSVNTAEPHGLFVDMAADTGMDFYVTFIFKGDNTIVSTHANGYGIYAADSIQYLSINGGGTLCASGQCAAVWAPLFGSDNTVTGCAASVDGALTQAEAGAKTYTVGRQTAKTIRIAPDAAIGCFTVQPHDLTADCGEDITITAEATGTDLHFSWTCSGYTCRAGAGFISGEDGISIVSTANSSTLTFRHPSMRVDDSDYACHVVCYISQGDSWDAPRVISEYATVTFNHPIEEGWRHNDETHWKDCSCGGAGNVEESPHTFGLDGRCTVCSQLSRIAWGNGWALYQNGELAIDWSGSIGYSSSNGAPWYGWRHQIASVNFRGDITDIGNYAFYECDALTEITLPAGLASIGSYAFYHCAALKKIKLPDSLEFIGSNYSFGGCTALREIVIPASVTYICGNAFDGCTGMATIYVDSANPAYSSIDGVLYDKEAKTLAACPGGKTQLAIPASTTNISVYSLSDCTVLTSITVAAENTVFSSLDGVLYNKAKTVLIRCPARKAAITIPAGVTEIRDRAFYKCGALREIAIPAGVTAIGNYTFYGCGALTEIALPAGITTIGNYTFYDCSALREITIPAGVTTIDRNTFRGCTGMTAIHVAEENAVCSSIDGILYDKAGTELLFCPLGRTAITIPSGVSEISDYAFYDCRALCEVAIPASVTTIGEWAFSNCYALADIYYAGSRGQWDAIVIKNENYNLSYVQMHYDGEKVIWTLENGVLTISGMGTMPRDKRYGAPWLSQRDSIQSVVIGSGVTNVADGAFYECTALKSVTLPAELTVIGAYAFHNCDALREIDIPANVTSIGDYALTGCREMTAIRVAGTNAVYSSVDGVLYDKTQTTLIACPAQKTGITMPSTVTTIAYSAFENCDCLQTVTLGWRLKEIQSRAFANCSSLKSITVPNSVTAIAYGTFANCTALQSVSIGSGVTGIAYEAFAECYSLQTVSFGQNVKEIGDYAFISCTALKNVTIPYGVTTLSYGAFENCTGLQSISLPNSVTSIAYGAFANCTGLQSVTLSDKLECLTERLFYNCTSLRSLYLPAGVRTIERGDSVPALENCRSLTHVTVSPQNPYFADVDGVLYNKDITELICCPGGKTDMTISNTVTSISYSAFTLCKSLKSVTIPASVREIHTNYRWTNDFSVERVYFEGDMPAFYGADGIFCISPHNLVAYYPYGNNTYTQDAMNAVGGNVVWYPSGAGTLQALTLDNLPNTSYRTGELLDLTGLKLLAKYDSGCEAYVPLPDITVSGFDSSVPGKRTITLAYVGKSVTYDVYAHNTKWVDISNTTESSWPTNVVAGGVSFPSPEALSLKISFSPDMQIADGETLYIWGGDVSYNFTQSQLAGQTITLPTGTIYLAVDDEQGTKEQPQTTLSISKIQAEQLAHVYGDDDTCRICGIALPAKNSTEGAQLVTETAVCQLDMVDELLQDGVNVQEAVQKIDTETLRDAMSCDESVVAKLKELEKVPASVTGSSTVFDLDEVEVVGASLNRSGNTPVKLVFGAAEATHQPSDNRKTVVTFSLSLTGAGDNEHLRVPVQITMPVPETVWNTSRMVILHYLHDGTVEELTPKITRRDGQIYMTLLLTSFSDLAIMANGQNYVRGDINGTASALGQVDATDLQCLFTYLSTTVNEGTIHDPEDFQQIADVNGDTIVNILDYQALYERITNKLDSDREDDNPDVSNVKVGVILVGDENEGYTFDHVDGIKRAMAACGLTEDNMVWYYNIPEDETCYDKCIEAVEADCSLVVTNSYGHQPYAQQAAIENPGVQFVTLTGDNARRSGLQNYCNTSTKRWEARYVSGVVAGMKVKELIENGFISTNGFDRNGNVKIGYVGAYPYAEVVSDYMAFYLGIKSIVPKAVMDVQYVNSWYDLASEGAAANALMEQGCVIIGQHSDSTGAPAAVQAARDRGKAVFSVGNNVDMRAVAPTAALTSSANDWSVYFTYAFNQVIQGKKVSTDWAEGYSANAVGITTLGPEVTLSTAAKVAEVESALRNGSLHVFDTSTFTVNGNRVTSAFTFDSDGDWSYDANEGIADGYYHESEYISAPSFNLRIDGITELN